MRKLDPEALEQREREILDYAIALIIRDGPAGMTMERLAAQVPFSKGTLYNHFRSREDVMVAVACRAAQESLDLFTRASVWRGPSRERFQAIAVAAELERLCESIDGPMLLSEEVMAGASPEMRERFGRLQNAIIGVFQGIVRDAISSGDLPMQEHPDELAFAAWSLFVGVEELHERKMIYPDLTDRQVGEVRRRMLRRLLDGYLWKPLSDDYDYEASRMRILREMFPKEAAEAGLLPG